MSTRRWGWTYVACCGLLAGAVVPGCDRSAENDAPQRDAAPAAAQPGGVGAARPRTGTAAPSDTSGLRQDSRPAGSGADEASLTIHFSREESTAAVTREAPEDGATLEAALRQLVRGPTDSERAAGVHSWFSPATANVLRSATVQQGRAIIDFADLRSLIPNASSSAGSAMLLRELNATVFEFPSLQSIEYRIDGSCEQFWEWLQHGGCPIQVRP